MSFVLTSAIAKQRGLDLGLRIDDMDSDRTRTEYVKDIFDSLSWLNINCIEGPKDEYELAEHWSQYHRIHRYDLLIQQLYVQGHLYACRCTRKQIAERGGLGLHECRNNTIDPNELDVSWRIRLPDICRIQISDEIQGKRIVDLNSIMPDFIIRRRDGIPSYQIASLADDLHDGAGLIIRGEDLLESTAAQLYLSQVLDRPNFTDTVFIHHPLMKSDDGKKLSKSDGADALKVIREDGISSEVVFSIIAKRLGITVRVFDLESFADAFDPQLHLRG